MIISKNPEPNKEEFLSLLASTNKRLNDLVSAKKDSDFISLAGKDIEPVIKNVMDEMAVGSPFENTIVLHSGQKFPDIVANKYYGVEVKTTTQNHWKTTGNSVMENTRVDNVERIFMMFAKLASPIEFRYRAYEDCLSDIVVTHSPRYLIDMNLEQGKTIFDKLNVSYDDLRKLENPISPIVKYYKSKLGPGEELWWIDSESNKTSSIVIKLWNNLTREEKKQIVVKSMVYFPEIFGNSPNKFGKVAIWLTTSESVVCPNIRDMFTASGSDDYSIGGSLFKNVPRIILNLVNNMPEIISFLNQTSVSELKSYWGVKTTNSTKFSTWIKLVLENSARLHAADRINFNLLLKEVYKTI